MPVNCPSCGKIVPDKPLCVMCGALMARTVKCAGCSRDIPLVGNMLACKYCGTALPRANVSVAPGAAPRPSAPVPIGVPSPAASLTSDVSVVACPACGQRVHGEALVCPACGKSIPGRRADPEVAGGAGAYVLAKEAFAIAKGRRVPGWLHALLLIFALPVLSTTLLLHQLMAKRWGRIPWISMAIDIFVMALFTMRSPTLFSAVVAGALSSFALLLLRHRKRAGGIFLGYSNLTTRLYMLAGVLLMVGAWFAFPWGRYFRLESMSDPVPVSARMIESYGVAPPNHVVIRDGALDLTKKKWIGVHKGEPKEFDIDPRGSADPLLAGIQVIAVGAPIQGSKVYGCVPPDQDFPATPPVQGVYTRELFGGFATGLEAIEIGPPAEYLRRRHEAPEIAREDLTKGSPWLLGGIVALVLTLRFALQE